MEAKIVKLRSGAMIPTRGSEKAAGYDLYACLQDVENNEFSVVISPGECVKIPTGISITPPSGYWGAIYSRSGLATKKGLRVANGVGVCDEDYTGEYIVALYNDSDTSWTIQHGDRIAQLVFLPYLDVTFNQVDSLEHTQRGSGGFGSTGVN